MRGMRRKETQKRSSGKHHRRKEHMGCGQMEISDLMDFMKGLDLELGREITEKIYIP